MGPDLTWCTTVLMNFCCFAPFLFFKPNVLSCKKNRKVRTLAPDKSHVYPTFVQTNKFLSIYQDDPIKRTTWPLKWHQFSQVFTWLRGINVISELTHCLPPFWKCRSIGTLVTLCSLLKDLWFEAAIEQFISIGSGSLGTRPASSCFIFSGISCLALVMIWMNEILWLS